MADFSLSIYYRLRDLRTEHPYDFKVFDVAFFFLLRKLETNETFFSFIFCHEISGYENNMIKNIYLLLLKRNIEIAAENEKNVGEY